MRFSLVRKGRFALVDFRRTLSTLISFDEAHVRDKFKGLGSGDVTVTKLRGNQQGVAVITLMNPERKNALTGYMMVKLAEAVDELEKWQDGKALVLRGSEGYFCSGGDLSVVKAINTPEEGNIMCAFMQRTLSRLGRLPLISVAAVEGRALGGGAEVSAEINTIHERNARDRVRGGVLRSRGGTWVFFGWVCASRDLQIGTPF